MRTFVCEGIETFYSSKGLTSLSWYRVLFLIGILISVFFGILSLQESFLLTPSVGRKIFLYICKRGDQERPRQGCQLRLLSRRGHQFRLLPRQGRQLCLLPCRGCQLRLLPRRGRQLRLLPRQLPTPSSGSSTSPTPSSGSSASPTTSLGSSASQA